MAIYIAVENDHRKLILLSATTFAVQAAFDSRPYLRPNLAREAGYLAFLCATRHPLLTAFTYIQASVVTSQSGLAHDVNHLFHQYIRRKSEHTAITVESMIVSCTPQDPVSPE